MSNISHKTLATTELHVPGYLSAGDPGAIGAGMYWVDASGPTGTWKIKVRNATNSGWEVTTVPLVINTLTGKTALAANDVLVLEDSADSFAQKKITYADLLVNLGQGETKGFVNDTAGYLNTKVDGVSLSYGQPLVLNPGFELWDAGWNPLLNVLPPPTSWTLSGTDAVCYRESTIISEESFSVKVVSAGVDSFLYQDIAVPATYDGKTLTLSVMVRSSDANRIRVSISTTPSATTYSSYHTGDSTWQRLTATHTCTTSLTMLRVSCLVPAGYTAYFDGVSLVNDSTTSTSDKLQVAPQYLERIMRKLKATTVKKLQEPSNCLSWAGVIMEDNTARFWGSSLWNGLGNSVNNTIPSGPSWSNTWNFASIGHPVALYGSYYNQYIVTSLGYVFSTGICNQGNLGTGATTYSPVYNIVTLASGAPITNIIKMEVSTGSDNPDGTKYALSSTGKLYAWGYGNHGQIGDGAAATNNYYAKEVVCPEAGQVWVDIASSAGYVSHATALTSNGLVYAWGYNGNGELGVGDAIAHNIPTKITTLSNITKVWSTGCYNNQTTSYALRNDGNLYCWGANNYGQFGIGVAYSNSSTPVLSSLLTGDVADLYVSKSNAASCMAKLKSTGAIKVWGYNSYGNLGIGSTTDGPASYTPSSNGIPAGFTKVAWGTGSNYYQCMALYGGTLYLCGYNGNSQMGTGSTSPTYVTTLTATRGVYKDEIVDMVGYGTTSNTATMVLTKNGDVYTCGSNTLGQLGVGEGALNDKTILTKVPFF